MGNKYVISITSFCIILFITFIVISNVSMNKASADETTVAAAPSAAAENDEPSYPPTTPPNSEDANNTTDVATTSAPDANVTETTPAPTVDDNSSDANVVNISNRKAPVSIAVYSDIITESADTYNYRNPANNTNNSTPENTVTEPTPAPTPTPENNNNVTPATAEPDNNDLNLVDPGVSERRIFIGDSRTVHMKQAVDASDAIWSCKSAMGLSWMKSTGVPNIESKIRTNTKIFILMGVNDLYNADKYITYINQKAAEWAQKGATTYFVSVNPIDPSKYKGFKNSRIENFNSTLQSGLKNVKYIDTYNYLMTHDFKTISDGLHYVPDTSKLIYGLIIGNM